jgi:hypothetical protein
MRSIPVVFLSAAGLSAAVLGCEMPHMTVPPDIGPATEEVVVDGHTTASGMFVNEDFKIGDFAVANVSRGAKSSSKFSGFGGFHASSESGYSFDIKHGSDVTHGECLSEDSDSGFKAGSIKVSNEKTKLGCACGNQAAPETTLVLESSSTSDYGGTLKAHDASYQVKAINERVGGLGSGPAGYRIDGQGPAGAVDVLGHGKVWLGKSLEPQQRADLTCVIAGLMLYKSPKNDPMKN